MESGEASLIVPARELAASLADWPGRIPPSAQPALAPGFPDLPELRAGGDFPGGAETPLREGCHVLAFRPEGAAASRWPAAVGTLRVESPRPGVWVASGDWYRAEAAFAGIVRDPGEEAPDRIPVHPRAGYLAYLRLESGPAGPSSGTGSLHRVRSVEFNVWEPAEPLVWRRLEPSGGPGSPGQPGDPVRLMLSDPVGGPLGELALEWRSPFFREAVVEIDTEGDLPAPVGDGRGTGWEEVFARVGWRVRVETGRLRGALPATGRWTYAELHESMLRSREDGDLDRAWRYHVSVVRHFAENPGPLGIAFDHEASDRNGVPREGVALQAGAALPAEALYGPYAGRTLRTIPEMLFQIAVHEVGHAMGLYHNRIGCGVMEQIDDLARHAPGGFLTADQLAATFPADDVVRLRHLPDLHVRPGGTGWDTQGLVDDRSDALDAVAGVLPPVERAPAAAGFELRLNVVGSCVPAGAPVRVDFSLVNGTGGTVGVPERLSLSTPHVHGWVVDPAGGENEFRSLFKPVAGVGVRPLGPGDSVNGSLTLLRGARGALFGRPGRHEVWVEVVWEHHGRVWRVRQRAGVEVRHPETAADAQAARRLVRTPETLGFLVFGRGRSFRAGEAAVDAALEAGSLRAHFAFIKARAVAVPHFGLRPDWGTVGRLLAEEGHLTPLNRREREGAGRLLRAAGSSGVAEG